MISVVWKLWFTRCVPFAMKWVAVAFSSDCSKFLYCWLWFQPTQTMSKHFSAWFIPTSQFLIHILYPLEKWFVTYFELAQRTIMHNFIAYVSTCDCLISKIDSKFCLGGLGSCAHTESELVLKNTIVKNLWVCSIWMILIRISDSRSLRS